MTGRRVAGLVLAAGSGSRFGGGKVRAPLDGRPLVAHVLAAARAAGLQPLVLVLGSDAVEVMAAVRAVEPAALDGVLVALNAAPDRGLATSLRLGVAAATAAPRPAGVVVLLGDQPQVGAGAIRALLDAAPAAPNGTLAIVPRFEADATPNPALLLPPAWPLAATAEGDRGMGPLLAGAADRVIRVPVAGANPDVDTRADLDALARAAKTPGAATS